MLPIAMILVSEYGGSWEPALLFLKGEAFFCLGSSSFTYFSDNKLNIQVSAIKNLYWGIWGIKIYIKVWLCNLTFVFTGSSKDILWLSIQFSLNYNCEFNLVVLFFFFFNLRDLCFCIMPFPSPGDLPDPGIEPRSPALQADALPSEPPGKPLLTFLITS